MYYDRFNILDNRKIRAIAIGGSAGSFQEVTRILASIPQNFPYPLILCLHRLRHVREGSVEALQSKSRIQVTEPDDKENIKNGVAYLAPANYHLLVEFGMTFALSTNEAMNFSRPSIDITLQSASNIFREKLVGIILSGASKDGATGMREIKENGGIAIIQKPEEAKVPMMPASVQEIIDVDLELGTTEIIEFLNVISHEKVY